MEYDIVKAKRPLSDKINQGTIGTILIVYEGVPPQFEVEFVNDDMESIEVLTVSGTDVEPVNPD